MDLASGSAFNAGSRSTLFCWVTHPTRERGQDIVCSCFRRHSEATRAHSTVKASQKSTRVQEYDGLPAWLFHRLCETVPVIGNGKELGPSLGRSCSVRAFKHLLCFFSVIGAALGPFRRIFYQPRFPSVTVPTIGEGAGLFPEISPILFRNRTSCGAVSNTLRINLQWCGRGQAGREYAEPGKVPGGDQAHSSARRPTLG